ncbi:MAG: hypothetical protein H0W08_14795 [Acidobacteria bacterium]|nr:hypothetical protein [Acidobacteriota bacterium]
MDLVRVGRAAFGWQYRGWAALAATTATLYFVAVLFPAAAKRSGSPENRIVDLQRAYTRKAFISVLECWSASKPDAVGLLKRHNLVALDLVFPALYAMSFGFGYAWLRARREPTPADTVLFLAPLVAASFDYVENGIHLSLLSEIDTIADVRRTAASGGFGPVPIAAASAAAHAKYLLLTVSAVGILIAAFHRLRALR